MTGAAGTSSPFWRRDYEKLSVRRQRVENRLSRERTRNARLAFAGFVVMSVFLTVGVNRGLAPPGFGPDAVPVPPTGFAKTRTGSVLFSSFDGVICKQLQFDNDTGRMTGGKLVRCDEAEAAIRAQVDVAPVDVAPASPQRALSIRSAFTK